MEPVANPRKGRHAIGAEAEWQRQVPLALCEARRPDPQGIAMIRLNRPKRFTGRCYKSQVVYIFFQLGEAGYDFIK